LVCSAAENLLVMKTELRILSILVLLAFNASHALAEPNRNDWRNELRSMQQQGKDQQPARQAQPAERSEGQSVSPANESSDQSRKPGKMTAEERRALRRQINEAGRDIYSSSH
jgi:hypothetical protein